MQLLSLLLAIPQAQAQSPNERSWVQRTFGLADSDGDGIPDREDRCATMPETVNGYADDDGCPDYLSFVTVQAVHDGRPLQFAEYWVKHDGREYTANGSALTLDQIAPGAHVEVAARYRCLGGQSSVTSASDPKGVRLQMFPIHEHIVRVVLLDDYDSPSGATLRWLGSRPSACAPRTERFRMTGGVAEVRIGKGSHRYEIRTRDGRVHRGVLNIGDKADPLLELAVSLRDDDDDDGTYDDTGYGEAGEPEPAVQVLVPSAGDDAP